VKVGRAISDISPVRFTRAVGIVWFGSLADRTTCSRHVRIQGREPPLIWSIEFMKKVHVASNDTAPLMFRCADTWLRASA
jgi:hypothetical protein